MSATNPLDITDAPAIWRLGPEPTPACLTCFNLTEAGDPVCSECLDAVCALDAVDWGDSAIVCPACKDELTAEREAR
jgi:hypothetical protein